MSPFIAPKNNTPRIIPTEGTHIARVISLIQIGTVEGYKGMPTNKIRITWELPEETHVFKEGEDAKPLIIAQDYTFSMAPGSNLRPVVEGIIGTTLTDEEAGSFNFDNILDQPCLVSLKHKVAKSGSKYALIASTSGLMKGQVCKNAYNVIKKLNYEEWDEKYFETLPNFIKDSMRSTPEYKKMKGITETADEIPF